MGPDSFSVPSRHKTTTQEKSAKKKSALRAGKLYDGFAIIRRALNGETPSVPGIGSLGGLRYLPFIKRCRDVACNVSTVVCLRN